jgi:hypothetical protein
MKIESEIMIQRLRSVIAQGEAPGQIAAVFCGLLLEAGLTNDDVLEVGTAILDALK